MLTMGMTLLSGCGGKVGGVDVDKMIDRYAKCCELGDYKEIEYNAQNTVVDDAMVKSEIDGLLSQYSKTDKIESGKCKLGDTVNIDFVGSVDGVEFEGGSTNGMGYDLELGSGNFIEGMEEQIAGHNVGETFDVNVTFPKEYPNNPDLAGKPAVFKVTINSINVITLPEYNDAFVASYTDAKTVAEYEENLKKEMEEYYSSSDDGNNKMALMEKILENVKINEYPEQDMKELIDNVVKSVQDEANESSMDLATYVTTRYGMSSEEEFRNYLSDQAKDYFKEKIAICAIAKAEKITVNKSDIEDMKKKMMESTGLDEKELKKQYKNEDIVYYALSEKVYNFILENGKPVAATNTDAE